MIRGRATLAILTVAVVAVAVPMALASPISAVADRQAISTVPAASLPTVTARMAKSTIRLSRVSVHSGTILFRAISTDGRLHQLQIARLHKGYTPQQARADLRRAFNGDVAAVRRLDHNVTFRGGVPAPRSGNPGHVVVDLTRGHYYVFGQDGQGLTSLRVHGIEGNQTPVAHQAMITANTYGFQTTRLATTGWLKVRNISDQPHFVQLTQVKNSTTRRMVARAAAHSSKRKPPWLLHAGTDSSVISPYRHEVLHYRLPPGKYLIACFWPDENTGMPHFYMGMWKLVTIASPNLNPSLVLAGTATRSSHGTITLTTNGQPHVVGAAWSPHRLRVLSAFTASFIFRISPAAPIGAAKADGLAFVIQNDPRGVAAFGQDGDEIGYGSDRCGAPRGRQGISHSLAVEFDTGRTPASFFCRKGSVGDPNANHISVLTRYRMPNSADEQYSLGSTTKIPNMRDGTGHHVTVSYRPRELSVSLDGKKVLSVPLRLARIGLAPGTRAYIGFTAATGDFTETHQIIQSSFRVGPPKSST